MRKPVKITDFLDIAKEAYGLPADSYKELTTKKIVESMEALFKFNDVPASRTITIQTGTRGMYHFNWAIALECGLIPESVERREVKLVGRLSQYTKEMVDENGEIWAWQPAYGKIHWTRLKLRADVPEWKDPQTSKFNIWRLATENPETVLYTTATSRKGVWIYATEYLKMLNFDLDYNMTRKRSIEKYGKRRQKKLLRRNAR